MSPESWLDSTVPSAHGIGQTRRGQPRRNILEPLDLIPAESWKLRGLAVRRCISAVLILCSDAS